MSGVNGLLAENSPPGHAVSSLQTLGRPCPDSRTNTWKLFALPRNAIPVGAFSPDANTDAVKPAATLRDSLSCMAFTPPLPLLQGKVRYVIERAGICWTQAGHG